MRQPDAQIALFVVLLCVDMYVRGNCAHASVEPRFLPPAHRCDSVSGPCDLYWLHGGAWVPWLSWVMGFHGWTMRSSVAPCPQGLALQPPLWRRSHSHANRVDGAETTKGDSPPLPVSLRASVDKLKKSLRRRRKNSAHMHTPSSSR